MTPGVDVKMNDNLIPRPELLRKLQRAAHVRSLVTMLSVLPILFVGFAVFGDALGHGGMAVIFFAGPLVVSALLTQVYCKRAVICPHCGGSLWHCGTGNFKPRRMKIRNDVEGCSRCHAKLA